MANGGADEAIAEGPISRSRHIAGRHRKFSIAQLAAAHRVAVDPMLRCCHYRFQTTDSRSSAD